MTGIAAVLERVTELRALVDRPAPVAATASAGFAQAMSEVTETSGAVAGGQTGQALVAAATKYLGVPYVWGGESADGLDCSGLVQRSMQDLGIDVPRVARDQMKLGTAVPSLDQALPGDLVVFKGGKHIGIYVGDGKMIDAPKPGKDVVIRDVYATPTAIRRVLPQAAPTAGTGMGPGQGSVLAAAQRTALDVLTGARS